MRSATFHPRAAASATLACNGAKSYTPSVGSSCAIGWQSDGGQPGGNMSPGAITAYHGGFTGSGLQAQGVCGIASHLPPRRPNGIRRRGGEREVAGSGQRHGGGSTKWQTHIGPIVVIELGRCRNVLKRTLHRQQTDGRRRRVGRQPKIIAQHGVTRGSAPRLRDHISVRLRCFRCRAPVELGRGFHISPVAREVTKPNRGPDLIARVDEQCVWRPEGWRRGWRGRWQRRCRHLRGRSHHNGRVLAIRHQWAVRMQRTALETQSRWANWPPASPM